MMIRPMTPLTASHPKRTNAIAKIRLLLWKNFLLQKHHRIHTIVDIFLPVLFFVFCAWLQKSIGTSDNPERIYASLSIDSLDPLLNADRTNYYPPINEHQLAFSPNNTIFKRLADDVSKRLELMNAIGVNDGDQLQRILVDNGLIAGIEFHHSHDTNELPKSLSYSLRFPSELRTTQHPSYYRPEDYSWQTHILFAADGYAIKYPEDDDGGLPSYYKEGFLAIQNAIAKAFVEAKNATMPEIQTRRFPTPKHLKNTFASDFQFLMPLFFLMSLNYTFMNTVRFISIEKEKQLKEAMKIMGLASWMHYLSWFIRTLVMLLISMVLITILITRPWFGAQAAIFPQSSFLCLLIFFLGYCICLITFGFVICAIFSRSKSAMTGSTILWYVTSAPFFFTNARYDHMAGWLKVLLCFCPNTAMSFGFKIIARLEDIGVGLNWHTAFHTVSIYDNLTIASIFGILIANSALLFMITLYIENVLPGGYGVAKPWYFIFTKDFWQKINQNYEQFDDHRSVSEHTNLSHSHSSHSNFESEPINKPIGIEIHQLTKKFMSDKAAVNKLTLSIFENQITSLLGQNGAGKTTAISMMTGMIEPTSGTALINGYDIRRNMDSARCSMGFCPQHNILFDELTVREHILFYCCLKGLSKEAADKEARKYIRLLDLEDKANAMSSTLSGGMKRKLSVVIALCGQSKVVFLDEPTSGMDPGARRALWDILLAEKKDRTILLTTHFMDEADVLSDRIAILADGELKCAGSTFFLKKRFGTGYHLICAKNPNCDSSLVTELLQKYIPDIRVENENNTEICYLLPEEENELFTTIFKDLESNESRLNINGFGVELTTLEEIFLKMGKSAQTMSSAASKDPNQLSDRESGISETRITLNDNHYILHGAELWQNQIDAMLKKRYLCWLRALPSFCYYNGFVILIMSLITFNVGALFPNSKGLPSLDINLNKYESPFVMLEDAPNSRFAEQFQKDINDSPAKLKITYDDMQKTLLEIAQTSMKEYYFQYLTAATVLQNQTIVAWFNGQAFHSATLALDLVHNALIKIIAGADYGIHVANKPLPFLPSNETTIPDAPETDSFGYTFALTIGVVMSVLSASYIGYHIKEKECNARFLQYASGVNLPIYWAATIIWDLLTNCVTICIIIILLVLGQHDLWKSISELSLVFLILLMYNIAMMPVICLLSLLFSKPSFGMNVISISNFVIMVAFMINVIVKVMPKWLGRIIWAYPLSTVIDCLLKIPTLHSIEMQCKAQCEAVNCDWHVLCKETPDCCPGNIFSWDRGIGKNLVLMFCTGIVAFIILIAIEAGAIRMAKQLIFRYMNRTYPKVDATEVIDDDVLAEKERVNCMSVQGLKRETLVMQNVSKFYGSFCAVNKISVAIKRGECFGLLGKNGAGKSSIFKMLTGETMISDGEIFTNGYNQKYQLAEIYKMIGYCPQFDALLSGLTCRETLEIFAMVRGIPGKDVKIYVENCARNLDFIQHIDKKVKQLSGGNKRKLSTSLAMIGNLSVIFLDEPSTGMDPATKRNLWNVIIQSRDGGKSIILTSHSMEECEALCTRITVFVNGQSKCLGSSQHLKNKFCKGFELKIKVKPDDEMHSLNMIEVKNFVLQMFSGAIFREEYQGILTYMVPADNIRWSSVFGIMENAKKMLKIEDYSISQNSLEQVILMFVKDQKEQNTFLSEETIN